MSYQGHVFRGVSVEEDLDSAPKYRSASRPGSSPFPGGGMGIRMTTGKDVAEYGDLQVKSVNCLPPPSALRQPHREDDTLNLSHPANAMYIEQNVITTRAPPSVGSVPLLSSREENSSRCPTQKWPENGYQKTPVQAMYQPDVAPENPPFLRLLRTHFKTVAGARYSMDGLTQMFRANSIAVKVMGAFRLACSVQVRHKLVRFSVRFLRGQEEESETTIIEFQREEGCGLSFSDIYRSARTAFQGWEQGEGIAAGALAATLNSTGIPPVAPLRKTSGAGAVPGVVGQPWLEAGPTARGGAGMGTGRGVTVAEAVRRIDCETARSLAGAVGVECPNGRRQGAELLVGAVNACPPEERGWVLNQPEVERALRSLLRSEDEAVRLAGMSVFATLCGRYSVLDREQQAWLRDRVGQLIVGLQMDESAHVQREAARALARLSGSLAKHIRALGGVETLRFHCRAQDTALSGFAMEALEKTMAC